MFSTLAQNARIVGFDSHSRHTISHFYHTHNTGAMPRILCKLRTVCLLNLPCVYERSGLHSFLTQVAAWSGRHGYSGDTRDPRWING